MKTKPEEANQYVLEAEELHYWYGLDLITGGPRSVTDQVIVEAKAKIPPCRLLQDPKERNCTIFYTHYIYEGTFFKEPSRCSALTNLYWDKTGKCAAADKLLKPDRQMFHSFNVSCSRRNNVLW